MATKEKTEENLACLRCESLAGFMNLSPDEVLCGDVTHELARRMDRDRMADVAIQVTELVKTFGGRGLGEQWIDTAEQAGRTLLEIAARVREAEEETNRRYGA